MLKTAVVGKAEQKLISKLIFNTVVPRPIAWITTLSKEGVINLAPFSFYNAVTTKPPIVVVSIGKRKDGKLKDTARNIRETGEFVINVVSKDFLEKMHISGKDFPPEVSEAEELGIELEPSALVKPPRVKGIPAALECKLKEIVEIGDTPMDLVIGEVVAINYREELLETQKGIVGRLGGKRYFVVDEEIDLSDL
ncbi:flavin reductase family protein [Phorcysia thermohydrogeniphila]|uniref:Flavin reductase (DIM6/NTAB) family NADH-FMN oxidoreductase RutF n=1 Tax=Phorcysia thermohydrogeniphila TaxID=936138 RepID=A0A4R1GA39_9BACT|nr:flavin reductase family protein [Phorcysia thermohydrogeniphila]TCK04558.1 flavin reductase (DIM6/NTAB) family NADH-FMN oxidoreductase RutF [Phorcysia thermohydrogeniphila]